MLAVMTLSAVKWSYFCIEYCQYWCLYCNLFSYCKYIGAFLGSTRITNIEI